MSNSALARRQRSARERWFRSFDSSSCWPGRCWRSGPPRQVAGARQPPARLRSRVGWRLVTCGDSVARSTRWGASSLRVTLAGSRSRGYGPAPSRTDPAAALLAEPPAGPRVLGAPGGVRTAPAAPLHGGAGARRMRVTPPLDRHGGTAASSVPFDPSDHRSRSDALVDDALREMSARDWRRRIRPRTAAGGTRSAPDRTVSLRK